MLRGCLRNLKDFSHTFKMTFAVIYEKTFQVKVPLNLYCFSEAERLQISRSFRKTKTHILLIAMPYYGFVPVIYPHFSCTLTFGNSPLIIPRAHDG